MNDELVNEMLEACRGLAYANGVSLNVLRPFADFFVNMLRAYGMTDDQIRILLDSYKD